MIGVFVENVFVLLKMRRLRSVEASFAVQVVKEQLEMNHQDWTQLTLTFQATLIAGVIRAMRSFNANELLVNDLSTQNAILRLA